MLLRMRRRDVVVRDVSFLIRVDVRAYVIAEFIVILERSH
jgi:hypothetical protein